MTGRPIARQHPKGQEGTVFATVEDEEGDVQPDPLASGLPAPPPPVAEQIILARGVVSCRDGAAALVVSDLRAIAPVSPCQPPTTGVEQQRRLLDHRFKPY